MARKIVITSGKGGDGKTSITASIGTSLANRGNMVLLIDGDVGLNNLDVVMGMESRVVYDMSDVIDGKCGISQALIQDETCENLYVLPSAHAYSNERISVAVFKQIIDSLNQTFDFILIDCPAGIEGSFHRAVCGAEEAIVITTPHTSAIRDADKVLTILQSYALRQVDVIVNRMRGDLVLMGKMMQPNEISKVLRANLLGIVPEDDGITVYSQLGRIGLSNTPSKLSFDMIADNILSGQKRLFDVTQRYKSVFGKIKMFVERRL
ncbi:MAG: septum site-determining protein MinD [Clostridia bacterium]